MGKLKKNIMENEIIQQILDKIDSTIDSYKEDYSLSSEARTWSVCALSEIKQFIKRFI